MNTTFDETKKGAAAAWGTRAVGLMGLDTETGGLHPAVHALLSVAVVCDWAPPMVVYITPESQPGKSVEPMAAKVNGYTPELWAERGAVPLRVAMERLQGWLYDRKQERREVRVVAHNAAFDEGFLREAERGSGVVLGLVRHNWRCSMLLFGLAMDEGLVSGGPGSLERLGELSGAWLPGMRGAVHDALEDAQAAVKGWRWLEEVRARAAADVLAASQTAMAKEIAAVKELHRLALQGREEVLRALNGLMPFVLEDYFPNCATPEFDAAVREAARVAEVDLAEVLKARGGSPEFGGRRAELGRGGLVGVAGCGG